MRTENKKSGTSWNPNYAQKGQWVMWSQGDNGWRTIILDTVTKVKLGNQFYKIG